MHIRRGDISDGDALFEIWKLSSAATHQFVSQIDLLAMVPQVRDYLTSIHTIFWVLCLDDGSPIGFMGMGESKMESLFLLPEHQGKGGGKRLVEHAKSLYDVLTVDVNESNLNAIGFYQACGFVVTGRSAVDEQGREYPLLHLRFQAG